jgi:hypothetical protein
MERWMTCSLIYSMFETGARKGVDGWEARHRMKRKLYVCTFLPAWILMVSAFCLPSMFVNVAEATALKSKPETPLPGYSPSSARSYAVAQSDTLDLPYSEPVPVPSVKKGDAFEETAAWSYIGYYTFANESMDESYGPGWLVGLGGVGWGERIGLGVEMGFLGCEGTPTLIDSDWDVDDSWVDMTAIFLEINVLYSFIDTSSQATFKPFVGLGPALWFGWERISTDASRMPAGVFESFHAELLGVGLSYGGCAMLGTTIRLTDDFSALVEVRGVLSSSGGMGDLVTEEDEDDFNSSLYSVVERPDFNFTGWRIDVGIQW